MNSTTKRIVYGDVLLVINFSMDFLALYITAKIMHLKVKKKQMTLSASLGALYALITVMVGDNSILNAFFSILMSFLLCFCAYGKQNIIHFIKNTAVFYIVNFSLGGGITAICNVLNMWKSRRDILINGTYDVLYGDIPFGLLCLLAAFCAIFSLISGKLIKRQKAIQVAELKISFGKNTITFQGLVDSGNLLKEPISGKPVVITSYITVRSIIPTHLLKILKTNTLSDTDFPMMSHIRLIPLSTVNGNGLLIAISPDELYINNKSVDAYIAIDTQKNDFNGYSAIIPAILTE